MKSTVRGLWTSVLIASLIAAFFLHPMSLMISRIPTAFIISVSSLVLLSSLVALLAIFAEDDHITLNGDFIDRL